MQIPLFQINTFSTDTNGGNPAGVCPLNKWLEDDVLLSIAKENNYSETAFFVPQGDGFKLRWFSPSTEIERCAHATLASAYVLNTKMKHDSDIKFYTIKENITVSIKDDTYKLNMRAMPLETVENAPENLLEGVGREEILGVYKSDDYLVHVKNEEHIRSFSPSYELISDIDLRGTILTASSSESGVDFVSRWFGSKDIGIKRNKLSTGFLLTQEWREG